MSEGTTPTCAHCGDEHQLLKCTYNGLRFHGCEEHTTCPGCGRATGVLAPLAERAAALLKTVSAGGAKLRDAILASPERLGYASAAEALHGVHDALPKIGEQIRTGIEPLIEKLPAKSREAIHSLVNGHLAALMDHVSERLEDVKTLVGDVVDDAVVIDRELLHGEGPRVG